MAPLPARASGTAPERALAARTAVDEWRAPRGAPHKVLDKRVFKVAQPHARPASASERGGQRRRRAEGHAPPCAHSSSQLADLRVIVGALHAVVLHRDWRQRAHRAARALAPPQARAKHVLVSSTTRLALAAGQPSDRLGRIDPLGTSGTTCNSCAHPSCCSCGANQAPAHAAAAAGHGSSGPEAAVGASHRQTRRARVVHSTSVGGAQAGERQHLAPAQLHAANPATQPPHSSLSVWGTGGTAACARPPSTPPPPPALPPCRSLPLPTSVHPRTLAALAHAPPAPPPSGCRLWQAQGWGCVLLGTAAHSRPTTIRGVACHVGLHTFLAPPAA